MKHYLSIMLVFLFSFFFNVLSCYADMYKGEITGNGVYLRSGPGTNYSTLRSTKRGDEYTLVSDQIHASQSGCSEGWYQLYYNGAATGYMCSKYVTVTKLVFSETPQNSCEQNLKDLGFPSSYWPGLCSLKEKHSNWQFKPILTNLDWSTAVNSESACGKSYIASSVETNIDRTCVNQYTSTWYPASSTAVAYYMDPRNWFSEKHIFQFEYLKYDQDLAGSYAQAATSVIGHSSFYKHHLNNGIDLGSVINNVGAANDVQVSPIFIAARILQEMGSTDKLYNLYSGLYEGYVGYYNFYNFGVSDECATSNGTTYCGLNYAYNNNWYGLDAAIKGGASQIASGYINKGQYTTYLQKFNVVPTESNKLYTHQYMTNIAAPSSESSTTHSSYQDLGLLNNAFMFYIPVYNNMNNSNFNSNSGAVDSPDNNTPSTMNISTIVTSSGYKYSSSYISGINAKESVEEVRNSLQSISGAGSVVVKNAAGVEVSSGTIGTGFKVLITTSNAKEELTVVINGDTSGDGQINALDLLQVQKDILRTNKLSSVYSLAGDTNDDGQINALDLLQVQKSILGTYTIVQ